MVLLYLVFVVSCFVFLLREHPVWVEAGPHFFRFFICMFSQIFKSLVYPFRCVVLFCSLRHRKMRVFAIRKSVFFLFLFQQLKMRWTAAGFSRYLWSSVIFWLKPRGAHVTCVCARTSLLLFRNDFKQRSIRSNCHELKLILKFDHFLVFSQVCFQILLLLT